VALPEKCGAFDKGKKVSNNKHKSNYKKK